MKINIEEVKQAQADQLEVIAANRLTVLQSIDDLESIGGTDDYVPSLRTIVTAYPDGILASKVQLVLPDAALLKEARAVLKATEIEEIPKGKRTILKPIAAAAPEPEGDDKRQAVPASRRR